MTTAEAWTTRRLLAWMQDALKAKGVDSPRLCAEMLLERVIGQPRLKLYTDADRPASKEELDTLRGLVGRALRHEPVQYLVGEARFFGLSLEVDARVLIPRPCTELLVEQVVQRVRQRMSGDEGAPLPSTVTQAEEAADEAEAERAAVMTQRRALANARARRGQLGKGLVIADVCTGSGCIAIALAKNLPGARILATDIALDALELAAQNARKNNVEDRIEFRHGSLLEPVVQYVQEHDGQGLDFIVSNPPYIPDHEWDAVESNVKDHEPTHALRGGADGLAFVRPIIAYAPPLLAPGGTLLMEIAACTRDAVLDLAMNHEELMNPGVHKDGDGLDRALIATRRS